MNRYFCFNFHKLQESLELDANKTVNMGIRTFNLTLLDILPQSLKQKNKMTSLQPKKIVTWSKGMSPNFAYDIKQINYLLLPLKSSENLWFSENFKQNKN